MKALEILKSPIVEIGSESDINLQSNAVVLFATREQIQEAIAELEALQQRSCQNCKHWKVRNTLVVSNECFRWSGKVMTPKDFCCNRYEPKEVCNVEKII